MQGHTKLQKISALLLSFMITLSMMPFYAIAADANTPITVSFGEIQWITDDEDLEDYDDIAGQRVLVVPIIVNTEDKSEFSFGLGTIDVAFNVDAKTIWYENFESGDPGMVSLVVAGKRIMGLNGPDNVEKANDEGIVRAVFGDTASRSYTVNDGQTICKLVFRTMPDGSGQNLQGTISFSDVRLRYYDDAKDAQPYNQVHYSTDLVTVPAYDPDAKTYTVHFDGNGATSGSMTDQDFPNGAAQNLSENQFARTGFDFDGWSETADGDVKYADKAQFTPTKEGTTTLYAQWKEIPKTYKVHFDGNGATSGSMDDQDFPDGAAQALSENKFTRTGFDFDGWSETADGDVKYADKAQFTPTEDTTTLYAQWKEIHKITVTVTPTEGGTVDPDKTTAKEGESVTLTVKPDMNNGYVLEKLTVTDSDGEIQTTRTNTMTANSSVYTFTMRKSNVTVNAVFVKPNPITIASDIEHGKVESDKTEAVLNEEVKLTVTPDTDPVIGMYVLKKLIITDSEGNEVPFVRTDDTTYAFSNYTFSMPDGPVTVTATFYAPHLVNLPENPENGSVESDKASAGEGDTVTLTVTPDNGYQIKTLKVTDANGEIKTEKIDENTYAFVMGTGDVTVQVEFEAVEIEVTVTYSPGEGDGRQFSESQKQPFNLPDKPDSFTPPSRKSFDGWTLPGSNEVYGVGRQLDLKSDTTITAHYKQNEGRTPGGCYVATAVYGSYDCPEVWTLRRFRDDVLAETWYGRLFIKLYYTISPTAVKLFGDTDWFQNFWRTKLDKMVSNLQAEGFASTPYQDIDW